MLKYFVVLLLCGLSLGNVCPPADKLSPCSCNEDKKAISCNGIRGFFDIKGVFDRVGPLIPDSTVFDKLEIFDTSLIEMPENSIQTLKFVNIDIMYNRNLQHIPLNAFNATYLVTKKLNMWNNYISNESPKERDIYNFLNKFKNVESIWIPGNLLTSVPEQAFDSLPGLGDLYLGSNGIKSIGANSFAKLPNLKKLYLSSNRISSDGIAMDAFKSVSKSLIVDLTYNNINFLDETSFKTLLENADSTSVGGHHCSRNGCSYTRLTCDSRADWICKDAEKYKTHLSGFLCSEKYSDIWDYCNKQPAQLNN